MSRPSLAVVLVVLGNPGVRGDVRMAGFSADASLDEVCDVLSAGSDSRRRALRVNALRALGKYVEKNFKDASKAAEWLTLLNRRLGVWSATSCAREVLHLVPSAEQRPRIAVDTAEAWVRGEATKTQAKKAADDAYAAAYVSPRGANAAACAVGVVTPERSADAAESAASVAWDAAWDLAWASSASAYPAPVAFDYEQYDTAAEQTRREAERRRLVTVISERLVLFPEWTGDPSDDRWPLPTKRNRR